MNRWTFAVALALAVVQACAAALPAVADPLVHPDQTVPDSGSVSAMTAAFVAAVGPFNGDLEASDALAAAHAGARVRRFAARETPSRADVIDALRVWAAGIRRERVAEARAPSIDRLGPIFGLLGESVDVVIVPADVQQRRDLAELGRLEGPDFDALYLRAHVGTLRQLEATYVDYIKNGDDQTLRALSVRDLKRVRDLLAGLPRA